MPMDTHTKYLTPSVIRHHYIPTEMAHRALGSVAMASASVDDE